jgi:hypothetical protein
MGPKAVPAMTRVRMTVIVDVPTANLHFITDEGPNVARQVIRDDTKQFIEAIPRLQAAEATVVDVH